MYLLVHLSLSYSLFNFIKFIDRTVDKAPDDVLKSQIRPQMSLGKNLLPALRTNFIVLSIVIFDTFLTKFVTAIFRVYRLYEYFGANLTQKSSLFNFSE